MFTVTLAPGLPGSSWTFGIGPLRAERGAGREGRRDFMKNRYETRRAKCGVCRKPARRFVEVSFWTFERGTDEDRLLTLCRRHVEEFRKVLDQFSTRRK